MINKLTEQNGDIVADSHDGSLRDDESIANAFLKAWASPDAKELSEPETEDHKTAEDAATADHGSDGNTEADDREDHDDDEDGARADFDGIDDEYEIPHKVNGKEVTFKIKDAKRLYGREAAIAEKETEVAVRRKEAETSRDEYLLRSQYLYNKAAERAKPYDGYSADQWNAVAQSMDSLSYKALRDYYDEARSEMNYLGQEITGIRDQMFREQNNAYVQQAIQTKGILEKKIPGFDQKMYNEMGEFAVSMGWNREAFGRIVDAVALENLYEFMMLKKGQGVKTTPVNKSPTKVAKPTRNPDAARRAAKPNAAKDAIHRAKSTGRDEDFAAAFLTKWKKD